MVMEIEIVSEETIKASKYCSTRFNVSLLDQLSPSFYVPIVLFYSAPHHQTNLHVVQKLKTSLSQTLAEFYPFAGRIYADSYAEARPDDGVSFTEARARAELTAVLENPDMGFVQKLLPMDSYKGNGNGEGVPALAVRCNVFDCGGVAVGLCIAHKIADGTTLSAFLTAWAQTSLDGHGGAIAPPCFDAPEIFPAREFRIESPKNLMKRGKIVARRLVFDSASLARLKAEAASGGAGSCTRVEAVTALICKAASESTPTKSSAMAISHVVNVRPRMDPPLPENTLGNIWRSAMAVIEEGREVSLSDLVAELRREIRKVDREYTAALRTEEGSVKALMELNQAGELVRKGTTPFYKFSSWVRFPIYETDFGWGKPAWACVTTVPIEGAVILLSDRSGGGVEAWVNLEEAHMACFQQNPLLLRFASQAPGS